jgi:hypothetical protein
MALLVTKGRKAAYAGSPLSCHWLRGVDLNHRPLGYEDSSLNESIEFQGLDAAGNDRKSLERHQSIAIGP